MKKWIVPLVIILTLSLPNDVSARSSQQEAQLLRDTLLTALNPTIQNEIIHYYGYPKQYGLYDAKILDLKREEDGGFSFRAKIQVTTFEAAHNPPYGVETMMFKINPAGVETLSYAHKGDEEERTLHHFYNVVVSDIKETFDLRLDSYTKYTFNQLQYMAQVDGEFKSLFAIAEKVVTDILNPSIQPPYKNVIDPVTYVGSDKGYIIFKKVDGTNVVYEVRREDEIWKVVNEETRPGKQMSNDLLWYM